MSIGRWIEKAPQLNAQTRIHSMVIFNDILYGGTGAGGRLDEYNDVDAWAEKAPQDNLTFINAMAVYNNGGGDALYAVGQGGPAFTSDLQRWNNVNNWVTAAPVLLGGTIPRALVVYKNKLYTSGARSGNGGQLWEYNDVDAWLLKAPTIFNPPPNWENINDLIVYDSGGGEKLYAAGATSGILLEWNDVDRWLIKADTGGAGIIDLVIFEGSLYATGGPGLLKWNDVDDWITVITSAAPIRELVVYHDRLYAGTATGELLGYDGASSWVTVATQLGSETILSLIVHDDSIFAGTFGTGKLYKLLSVGKSVGAIMV